MAMLGSIELRFCGSEIEKSRKCMVKFLQWNFNYKGGKRGNKEKGKNFEANKIYFQWRVCKFAEGKIRKYTEKKEKNSIQRFGKVYMVLW